MQIGPFDTLELITLAISLIAGFFIYKAYKERINTPESKKFWAYFLLIAYFLLLNRAFPNMEALAFKTFFQLVEHLSILVVALIFVLVTKNALKGEI